MCCIWSSLILSMINRDEKILQNLQCLRFITYHSQDVFCNLLKVDIFSHFRIIPTPCGCSIFLPSPAMNGHNIAERGIV